MHECRPVSSTPDIYVYVAQLNSHMDMEMDIERTLSSNNSHDTVVMTLDYVMSDTLPFLISI